MIYERLLRPVLFRLWSDPEDAHEYIMSWLEWLGHYPGLLSGLSRLTRVSDPRLRRTILGIEFPNPVGLAGGFDKNAIAVPAFEALGFGFLEVGTVTARPQPGNDRPRVFRLPCHEALINRFGFNNQGALAMAERLTRLPCRTIPLGISLGKSKVTPLEEAVEDYLFSLRALYPHGDYFAINVSSPNTPGLRKLQGASELDELLAALTSEAKALELRLAAGGQPSPSGRTRKPILVKVAPDLEWEALDELLGVCVARGVDGIIATNTTISRDPLGSPLPPQASESGGLSGRPLHARALEVVRHIRLSLPAMPIIGVGGIMTPDDARAMLDAGADLLQIYTGLIYHGPFLPRRLNRALLQYQPRRIAAG